MLPLRYCALSTCFRKEAGSQGKDTLGIFRVHQFEKIEQFIYSTPEDSKNQHEKLMQVTESIYQKLNLPYQVIAIVSSALNDNAAIKYDLEAWFPGSNTFRELVSCTNCKDYQARKTKTRFGRAGSGDAQILHTLNSTAIATERTMCCILENYQQADGSIKVPDVLVPYMNGKTVMFAHGHQDKKTSVVQDFIGATREFIDYIILAHFHSSAEKTFQGTKVFISGSIIGTDAYAYGKRLFSEPEQKLLVFEDDNVLDFDINLKNA